MEPWFHLYKIEQIIGRGIRRCSHYDLDEKERNVTIYLHVSSENKDNKETVDITEYRIGEDKANDIGEIEIILKENSIDCFLNKDINYIDKKDINKRDLLSSQKIQHFVS